MLLHDTKTKLHRVRHAFYEQGNKPGRLLDRSLRELALRNYIPFVDKGLGQCSHTSREIVDTFHSYYTALHNLNAPMTSTQTPNSLICY